MYVCLIIANISKIYAWYINWFLFVYAICVAVVMPWLFELLQTARCHVPHINLFGLVITMQRCSFDDNKNPYLKKCIIVYMRVDIVSSKYMYYFLNEYWTYYATVMMPLFCLVTLLEIFDALLLEERCYGLS